MTYKFTIEKANAFTKENSQSVKNQFKPEIHFTAPIGWINDPNGFIFFKGEYHLFYQHYPYGSEWGPMHWGHTKTKDFLTWEHLPIALAPDMPYDKDGCFSGSAIVKDDKLWLMYTGNIIDAENGNQQVQNMAYSTDGITFKKLDKNPVATGEILPDTIVKSDFRDPKVFEKDGIYYAVVAAQDKKHVGSIILLSSLNLIDWSFESIFLEGQKNQGVMWECPDYFEIDGTSYLVLSPMRFPRDQFHFTNINSSVILKGEVDWETKTFKMDSLTELDQGHDFYAPQTLVDEKGRRIMIAWMHTWGRTLPTHELNHKWAGQMTMPRELHPFENGIKQAFLVEVVENLPTLPLNQAVETAGKLVTNLSSSIHYRLGEEGDAIHFGYDQEEDIVYINRSEQAQVIKGEEEWPIDLKASKIKADKLTVIIDKNAIEIIVNDGQAVLSSTYYLTNSQPILEETKSKWVTNE